MKIRLIQLEGKFRIEEEDTHEILWEGTSEYEANNVLKSLRPHTHGDQQNINAPTPTQRIKDIFG